MYALRSLVLVVSLAALAVLPASAGARLSDAAPKSNYTVSVAALLGPNSAELAVTVTPPPPRPWFEKVQVKVWPADDGPVVTRNYFHVSAPGGDATIEIDPLARLQRVQVRVHVKDGSQNSLQAETVAQYRALGAVSSDHREATAAGEQILNEGGNAFDAAAAVLFALNVTQPHLAGIGGSSNVVLYSAAEDRLYAIDGRETAPQAATAEMLDGRSIGDVSVNGYSVGVPGTLLTVERMLQRWGTRSLAETMAPAIRLAEHGFQVGAFLEKDLQNPGTFKAGFPPQTKTLFTEPDGTLLDRGDSFVQPDLAATFRLIARNGSSVFYRGEIAPAIVAAQRWSTYPEGVGRLVLADLAAYDVVVRSASHLDYRGYDVYAAAPSSRGGLVLLEALGVLEASGFPIGGVDAAGNSYDFGSRYALHAFVESLRLALADRVWVGDPAFLPVPEGQLLSEAYLSNRAEPIQPFPIRMTPAVNVPPGNPLAYPGPGASADEEDTSAHTTHFSVIDRFGNVVSFTTTMADSFGSGILVDGYGFLLNDSVRLFKGSNSAPPDVIAPGKRPPGNMTPVVLMKDGEPVAATGTYGSSWIPSLVFNTVVNLVDYDMSLQEAVDVSRFWIAVPDGAWAWNHGRRGARSFPQAEIEALWALGPRRPLRVPTAADEVFGSFASVGVDPATLDLVGATDDLRQVDAGMVVVPRGD